MSQTRGRRALRRLVPREPVTLLVGLGVIVLLLIVFVLLPIVQVVTFPPLTDYLGLAENRRWVRAASNTGRMVVLSTASATAARFRLCVRAQPAGSAGPRSVRLIAMLPLFSPPFTLGFSYLLMFGRFGLITHDLAGLETSILGWRKPLGGADADPFPLSPRSPSSASWPRRPARLEVGRAQSRRRRLRRLPDHHLAARPTGGGRRGLADRDVRAGRLRQPAGHRRRLPAAGDRSLVPHRRLGRHARRDADGLHAPSAGLAAFSSPSASG